MLLHQSINSSRVLPTACKQSRVMPKVALPASSPSSPFYPLVSNSSSICIEPRWCSRGRARTRASGSVVCHALPEYILQEKPPARLAVFVSGGGSNMKALHSSILEGRMNAEIAVVVSDKPSCGGVQYAEAHGIKTLTFPIPKSGSFPGLTTDQLVEELRKGLNIDYVILAGYLKLIPGELTRAFPKAMLNIHPGLLPGFGGKGMYGERVHKAVIASGARFSGPTVHFVDEEFDTGPILAQAVVPVKPTDTPKQLAARVLVQEHTIFPHAVSALVDGRVSWREDGVPILWSDS